MKHPRRRADRDRVQPDDRLRVRRRPARRRASSSTPRPGTITAWNPACRADAERDGHDTGRGLQGPGHRRHEQRARCSTRPTSTTARSTCSTTRFAPVHRSRAAFTDPNLPAGFAPFNVQELGGRLYVTYAKQDADAARRGRRPGPRLRRRLRHERPPAAAARLAGTAERAVGPGDRAAALRRRSAATCSSATSATARSTPTTRRRALRRARSTNKDGNPIQIDGLWALRFGNGVDRHAARRCSSPPAPATRPTACFGEIVARGSGE